MRSMVVTLILALCVTVIGQSPSLSTTTPAPTASQQQGTPTGNQTDKSNQSNSSSALPLPAPAGTVQNQSAGQPKKHGRTIPPERNHAAQANANPASEDNASTAVETAKQPPDRWFLAYVIFTGVLALIGLSGLGVVRRQLREMKEARKQTDSLIKRAIEQSSALEDAAEQTDRLIEQAIQQANTAAEQAKAANMAACAAKTNSEHFAQIAGTSLQSLHLAQEAMRLEQRAWVFVTETRVSELQTGKPLSIIVGFKNTGRTPAKNVQIATAIDFLPQGQAPEPNLEKTQSRGIIPPNGTLFVTIGAGRKNAEGITEKGMQA